MMQMKKFMKWVLVLVVTLSVGFLTGCDDDENGPDAPKAQLITDAELADLGCYMDLHLHLDGSISVANYKKLAAISGIEVTQSDAELQNALQVPDDCKDLNEYLKRFDLPLTVLQTPESIEESVVLLADELKQLGYIYAEIRYAPQKHRNQGLTQREVIEATIRGAKRSAIPVRLILCCMRGDENHEENMETVELAGEYLGDEVAAIDLAGAEALYPTPNFTDLFQRAQTLGVPFTIHAGEADGPESVKAALACGTKRIGHGVRSKEDSDLVKRLAEEGITLECCPKSNLDTKIFADIEEYPFRYYLEQGVHITINSDNMVVSNTNVIREFQRLNAAFQLTKEEVKTVLQNSVRASFASETLKATLLQKIDERLP